MTRIEDLKDGKILLVDDEPFVRRTIHKNLERRGFTVVSAGDALEALQLLRSGEFSAGIFDIILPGKSGTELLDEALDFDPDLNVIMITGMAEVETVIKAMRLGAFSFIRKPLDFNELELDLRNALKERRLTIENREYSRNLERLVDIRTAELRKSQEELTLEKEKLENVLKNIGAGLQVISSQGITLWSNPIAKEWFGEEAGWQTLLEAQSPGTDIVKQGYYTCFEMGETYTQSFSLKCLDNAVREFQLDCYPVMDASGQTIQAVALIQDVTEPNVMRRELMYSEKLASIGEISASLAHEINNPVGIILGFIQNLLIQIDDTHPFYEDLKIVEEETVRTGRVIKQLLQYSRQRDAKREVVLISDIWRRCQQFFDYMFKEKHVNVKTEICDGSGPIIGDPDYLHQAFVNIVLNSLQAMSKGGELSFRCEEEESADGVWVLKIEIKDTGTGISPEDMGKIFDPFFTKKGREGTGLGLSNSKRIIEGHGGTIKFHSEFGKGTTCTIRLPI